MNSIRERVLKREFMAGTWCSLGSSVSAEIAGLSGYDWALLDMEHAPSTTPSLMQQMQALAPSTTAPIVRIPWLDRVPIKWALDIGASGIMVPYVETVEDATFAVSCMRYGIDGVQGIRGVAGSTRASDYGYNFKNYFAEANQKLLTIVQMETQKSVDNCEAIAAVDGVDVLFVGPMDLSTSINMPKRFADPEFKKVLQHIADRSRAKGKACGILLPTLDLVPMLKEMGYTFVAVSSDVNILAKHLKEIAQAMRA